MGSVMPTMPPLRPVGGLPIWPSKAATEAVDDHPRSPSSLAVFAMWPAVSRMLLKWPIRFT